VAQHIARFHGGHQAAAEGRSDLQLAVALTFS